MLRVWGSETEEDRKANMGYLYGQLELSIPEDPLKNNVEYALEFSYLRPGKL